MCACVNSGGCAGADTAGLEFRWMQTLSDLLKTLNDARFRVIGGLSVLAAWVETDCALLLRLTVNQSLWLHGS